VSKLKVGVDVGENDAEPRQFLECALLAEEEGFDSFWFGDHFMPWIHTGGKSVFVWSLLASSLERTNRISMGPNVTCPIGGRYHPAIVAQAAATLDNMYPGRVMLGVGSGEAVNEARFIRGRLSDWPNWRERIERLTEAVTLIRELWSRDDYFTFNGKYFPMRDVTLCTKPKTRIPIYIAAMGPNAATLAGRHGDNLTTIRSPETCRNVIFPKFNEAIRLQGKKPDEAERMVLVNMAIGDPEESMRKLRSGWAGILAKGAYDDPDPRRIEASAATVEENMIREYFQLLPKVEDLVALVREYEVAGADHIVLETGPCPDLIRSIARRALPHLH
jgi:coenzyme F420-dependent glucose-6-phosphate dehydrogenase